MANECVPQPSRRSPKRRCAAGRPTKRRRGALPKIDGAAKPTILTTMVARFCVVTKKREVDPDPQARCPLGKALSGPADRLVARAAPPLFLRQGARARFGWQKASGPVLTASRRSGAALDAPRTRVVRESVWHCVDIDGRLFIARPSRLGLSRYLSPANATPTRRGRVLAAANASADRWTSASTTIFYFDPRAAATRERLRPASACDPRALATRDGRPRRLEKRESLVGLLQVCARRQACIRDATDKLSHGSRR
jgi:hypothetical protein